MYPQHNETQPTGFWTANRLTIKGIIVGILILLMLIPAAFIFNLVEERGARQEQVIREEAGKWANAQHVTGPLLLIPYVEKRTDEKGTISFIKKTAYVLPDRLNITGSLLPQTRYRSIYPITVYTSDIEITGSFGSIASYGLNIPEENLLLQEARICMGISDFRGIEEQVSMVWDDAELVFSAGLPDTGVLQSGLSAATPSSDLSTPHNFSLRLRLRGSEKLGFVPIGNTTLVQLEAPWADPSFGGQFLPSEQQISAEGFVAHWKVQHLNRNYPQSWKESPYNLNESAFWVTLLQPVDSYAKTMRSVKYAILFISLSFGLYFFVEILQRKAVHPIQYILMGLALSVFYTLLLSISEYTGFNIAYAIAALATVTLITLYTKSIFTKWKVSFLFGGLLAMLYGFIFMLIQLQDNALLFGSIGLFILLAVVMFYSRKIDWYGKLPSDTTAV